MVLYKSQESDIMMKWEGSSSNSVTNAPPKSSSDSIKFNAFDSKLIPLYGIEKENSL